MMIPYPGRLHGTHSKITKPGRRTGCAGWRYVRSIAYPFSEGWGLSVLPHLSKGRLSKETMVQGTAVQGDFGPRKLLSKEDFTSDKLAQINFFHSLLDITIVIDYKMTKKNLIALNVSNF